MHLIVKTGVLTVTLTALLLSFQAGVLESTAMSATLDDVDVAKGAVAQRAVVPIATQPLRSAEVIVSLPSCLSPAEIDALRRHHRLTLVESQSVSLLARTVHRWRIVDGRSIPDVILALERDGGIDAHPNHSYNLQ